MKGGDLLNTEKLPVEVRKRVIAYCHQLISLYQDNLKSIFLYGSVLQSEDFIPKKSNINLGVILYDLQLSELRKALKLVAKGRRKGIVAPLFLTVEHMRTSQDSFPIEFLQMKENYLLLYGEDFLKNLEINRENLRLQCEQQLKGKLIKIRQAYLELGLRKKGIEKLLHNSFSSLLPTFRNLIRLKENKIPPVSKEEIIREMSSLYEVDGETFLLILRDKQGDEKICRIDAHLFLERYLKEIEKLSIAVDRL
ncbi:MAG: hypothetical protein DRP75_02470 [Candidatus Omnitrophota bacterium]|nr:MAG: hypothetical protein DRP75_02470 [Candidatus Omnitrophota bacterium]